MNEFLQLPDNIKDDADHIDIFEDTTQKLTQDINEIDERHELLLLNQSFNMVLRYQTFQLICQKI